jgi:pimeloyl-ACP methyl ester carboxylesterase
MQTIWKKTKTDFTRVLFAGATIWPPAQVINFFFVPLPYRVLFMNMVGFGWSTYTSLVASQAFHHPHLAKADTHRRHRYRLRLYPLPLDLEDLLEPLLIRRRNRSTTTDRHHHHHPR